MRRDTDGETTEAGVPHATDAGVPHARAAALVLDASGSDLLRDTLRAGGIETESGTSLTDLLARLPDRGDCLLIQEDLLTGDGIGAVRAALGGQPGWSDLPVVVLAGGALGERSGETVALLDTLGHMVIIVHPPAPDEVLRAVRVALRVRARQHEAHARLDELALREAQLRESEAEFHAIADSVDQMIWSTRPDGFHDYFNARWYDYTGVPRGSTDGMAWNGIFHPEDQPRAREVWRRSLETGEPYHIEYRLRHRSGAYRWVLGRAQPVRGADGAIVRWYGTCTDIDDEVEARRAEVGDLTRQRDAAWSASREMISVADTDGRIEAVNPSWTRILGYGADELKGLPGMDIIHPDDRGITRDALARVASGPVLEAAEVRMRHRDGSYRRIAFTASPIGDRIVAFGRDVTEERARDAALAATEAALRQSQKLETIGQLTGGVAHDFNNLLMAIRASMDLLDRHLPRDDARARRLTANARRATERGASLTQRMLAFARRQALQAAPVDVARLLEGMRDLLARSLGPQVEIAMAVSADVPPAMVDANQLEMAVLNLGVNARDAMEGDGRVIVALDLAEEPGADDLAAGTYVRVAVRDDGPGMDAATLAQATEPFFTTKGVGKGTGLGLSMVHGLARQSGGTFRLRSAPGAGTEATLLLPVADAAAPAPAPAAPEATVPPRSLGKARLTILAVDDDVLVLMGTAGLLEDLGHEVIEAHSGAAALAVLETRDVDLLLTDQAMPRMTGVELARQARARDPGLPVVLATGYAEMPDGAADLVDARLEKPFSPADLARAIAQVTQPA